MSGKNDYLNLDLNELVNKEIHEKIVNLEKTIETKSKYIREQDILIQDQNLKIEETKLSTEFLWKFRQTFSGIKPSAKDSFGYTKSLVENQFNFIENILKYLFNIEKEHTYKDDTPLAINLAINYYKNKETVIDLLKIIMVNPSKINSVIYSFKMPYDYTKEELLEFVKKPKYNTNGIMFGINCYWTRYGASKENMPYDFIMIHPNFLDDDVFDQLLETIKLTKDNWNYLLAFPKYNKNVTTDHIIKIGECLINLDKKFFGYEEVDNFIKTNLKGFNRKTLEFFYSKVTHENQYKPLHWENFNVEYQKRFLINKPFEEMIKILMSYNCTWTINDKEEFLKTYFNNEQ